VINHRRAEGRVVLQPNVPFDGVKIFAATVFADRATLGEKLTEWIAQNPRNEVTEIVVTQSSDEAFHCLAFTVFFRTRRGEQLDRAA
jgi:hypothetical protein